MQGSQAYGCGQCDPCRFNRRRTWAHRIMLEASMYTKNMFLNLTYNDSSLPVVVLPGLEAMAELRPKHLQDWLKRFRKAISPSKIRYFAVGEYGDESFRPHYHAIIFNFPTCVRGRTKRHWRTGEPEWRSCCEVCKLVGETWGHGNVDLGEVEVGSAQYVCGYVVKKLTSRNDERLAGREPEFSRMSLRPGIGAPYMDEAASTFLSLDLEKTQADVPSALRHGGRELPLGRYLRRQFRVKIGRAPEAPRDVKREAEMHDVLRNSIENQTSLKKQLVMEGNQKVAQMMAKSRIYRKRRSL